MHDHPYSCGHTVGRPYQFAFLALFLISGCESTAPKKLPRSVRKYSIPTVAVLDFENKVATPLDWNLGRGMRDLLVDELVGCGRFQVVTRGDLDAVIAELEIQKDSRFRKQGKVAQNRLKNVKYLVKGAVTEFSHVAGGGLRAVTSKLGIGGGGQVAIVAVTLYVIDVESGEISASDHIEGRAYAGKVSFNSVYKNVRFGGGAFYRTPLGRATKDVIGRALDSASRTIARVRWHPRVAKVQGTSVIVSGGIDRALKVDSLWEAISQGEEIIDPETGDVLGRTEPRTVGVVRILEVKALFSVGEIVDGECEVGQQLRPVSKP